MKVLCANYAEVFTGQWGNQQIVTESFRRDPKTEELLDRANDPALPIVVWSIARTRGGKAVHSGWQPPTVEEASHGGPWQVADYQTTGGNTWTEKLVCDYLVSACHPRTAIDLGCGAGLFVQYLNAKGVDAYGVEAADLRSIQPLPDKFIQQDLRVTFDLEQHFDLVLCLEVAEHIDAAFEPMLFENIHRHAGKYLLFSAAVPGQEGHGHVNEHTEEYWFTVLRELGFRLLVDQTNICRALCKHPWYAKNISLWELAGNSDAAHENEATQLIERPDSYMLNLEELYKYQEGRIAEIEQSRAWLEEQRANWLAESEHWAAQLAEQKSWIAELEQSRAWLEEQRANWQQLAEQRQQQLGEQQSWIAELEQAKIILEDERASWQRHAEEAQQKLDALESAAAEHRAALPTLLAQPLPPESQEANRQELDAIMTQLRQKLRSRMRQYEQPETSDTKQD
jgi:hypothetical protein